jgi:hypothetical protein
LASATETYTIATAYVAPANLRTGPGELFRLDAWSSSPTADQKKTLDLRHNQTAMQNLPLPAEVLEQTDAQALIAAWRRFRQAEANLNNSSGLCSELAGAT